MEETEKGTYEPPVLQELGRVHDLTEGLVSGAQPDLTFPHQPISV